MSCHIRIAAIVFCVPLILLSLSGCISSSNPTTDAGSPLTNPGATPSDGRTIPPDAITTLSSPTPSPSQADSLPSRSPDITFYTTEQVTKNPELAKRLDALATDRTIEARTVGINAAPSSIHKLFQEAASLATRDELRGMGLHIGPVIRGYTIGHFERETPTELQYLYPLFRDGTSTTTFSGCIAETHTVAELMALASCERRGMPKIHQMLVRAARDPKATPSHASVLRCLTPVEPEIVARLATESIGTSDPDLLAASIEVSGLQKLDAVYGEVLAAASHEDERVYRAATIALGRYGRPGCEALLGERLKTAYFRYWLEIASALAAVETPEAIAILEPALLAEWDWHP